MIWFSVYAWRDIMKTCGPMIAIDEEDRRIMLTYINIQCVDNRFTAYGCDGYHLARIRGKCDMMDKAPVSFIIKPHSIPARTDKVRVSDIRPGSLAVAFLDKNARELEERKLTVDVGEVLDYENKVIEPNLKNMDSYNHGEGQYMFVVNPRYLMDALQGVKTCQKVILNFGSQVQPVFIRPYMDEYSDILEMVWPVRIFNGDEKFGRVRNE